MDERAGFCVIYPMRVRPSLEASFRSGWSRMTEAIRAQREGLGSRLHRGDDGLWYAYAQWPDRAAWERSRTMESPDPEAAELMNEAVVDRLPPILLAPTDDLLARIPAGPIG